ncbi:putative FBD-associated F-box protein At5g56700 isoform X2 [Papaver somniferum]|uniref:putative FBD-associated F-box protein At5g56700 isoform X2 n=1 Tax=Papaver somniferum TaxID=3469 RepID=UPI000E700195|nr:putative FBD-associated F-box protein At5g56700 isoform X2 [Papaver somniferum]
MDHYGNVYNVESKSSFFSGSYSYPNNGKMIPDSLFTCESLTTLDFQFVEQDGLDLPKSISLPRLKILRLTNIVYDDEKLAGKLFSSCPVLEELCLTDCSWQNLYFIRVSAPRLKSFTLTGCLRNNMEDVKVKIDAPNLSSFTFCDWLPEDFVVDSFPLLHDADLYYNYGDIESRFLPIYKFVANLCNVKVLKISGAYFKVKFSGKVDENTLTFNKVPSCLECLKSIEFQKFNGYPKELEMVKFVLKHARVLQTVTMETSYTVEDDDMDPAKMKKNLKAMEVEAVNKKITTQLGMSPWASAGCVIKFSSS